MLSSDAEPPEPARWFPHTAWSSVARARDSREEFARLLTRYRNPLLQFAQARLRVSAEDAEDAVGELYAALLAKDSPLEKVHPAGGRFRTWLATCLQNRVMEAWRRASAEKRGGGRQPVALETAREGSSPELTDSGDDPAEAFDRAFARSLYDGVLAEFLREAGDESTLEGRIRRVAFEGGGAREQELMEAFGVSRATVSRARAAALKRFRVLLRTEIESLVENAKEADEELDWLLSVLRN